MTDDDRLVMVCGACKRACCWLGKFYCDAYRMAPVISLPVSQLAELKLESPHYWGSQP